MGTIRQSGAKLIESDVPGEQVFDAVDGMIRDAGQHGTEIELRVEAGEFSRADQRVDVTARWPPESAPAKRQLRLPRATARNARSALELSISISPSST